VVRTAVVSADGSTPVEAITYPYLLKKVGNSVRVYTPNKKFNPHAGVSDSSDETNLEQYTVRKRSSLIHNAMGEDQALVIPADVRTGAGEILFGENQDGSSIASLFLDAVLKLSSEVRAVVSQNIVLCGGTSMLPGLSARFLQQVIRDIDLPEYSSLLGMKSKLRLASPSFSANCLTWVGGSIMASLQNGTATTDEYLQREQYLQDRLRKSPTGETVESKDVQASGLKAGIRPYLPISDRRKLPDWTIDQEGAPVNDAPPRVPNRKYKYQKNAKNLIVSSPRKFQNSKSVLTNQEFLEHAALYLQD